MTDHPSPAKSQPERTPSADHAQDEHRDWTVALYLGNTSIADPKNNTTDSEIGARKLETLREKTKDGHVTIVADILDYTGVAPLTADKTSPRKPGYEVTRMILHDGIEEIMPRAQSQGTESNLRSLVSFARSHFHSDKLAVVFDGHGDGDQGVQGGGIGPLNDGFVKPDKLAKALAAGAPAGTKVDLLNLAGCFGAQLGNLRELSSGVNNLVASETASYLVRYDNGRIVSQELDKWLDTLAANPKMTGRELADAAIDNVTKTAQEIAKEFSGSNPMDPTPHVAGFDLSNGFKHFDKLLSSVGNALSSTGSDSSVQDALFSIVQKQKNIGTDANLTGLWKKADLQEFLNTVKEEIASGRLQDSKGKIARSITALSEELKPGGDFITSAHMVELPGRPRVNGLSVYMPVEFDPFQKRPTEEVSIYKMEAGANQGWRRFLDTYTPGTLEKFGAKEPKS